MSKFCGCFRCEACIIKTRPDPQNQKNRERICKECEENYIKREVVKSYLNDQNSLAKELEDLRNNLAQATANIQLEKKKVEDTKSKNEQSNQNSELKKNKKNIDLMNLVEEIEDNKIELDKLNQTERTLNGKIQAQKSLIEKTKEEASTLQDAVDENNVKLSNATSAVDGLLKDVARIIDDVKNRKKKGQKGNTRMVNSEVFGKIDTLKSRELVRSRVMGNSKKNNEQEINSGYACKCAIF